MADASHISEDDLERYAMGTVKDEAELTPIEEHLLVCGECLEQAEKSEEFLKAMRAALRRLQARRNGA
jgi:hypothetical protein